ncbi:MAG TPA: helix-turn-helix transcriptional regulator [Rugosimonospora sp.]|nr:helix-turn-helix transcriptional regulator [Rugosimonospora sp.]
MPNQGSNLVRRSLGRRLRKLREAAGKKDVDVVEASICTRQTLWRIETGKSPVKVPIVRSLCWLYGADNETTDALCNLALGTATEAWWEESYGDVLPSWFKLYLDLEAGADEIRTYTSELVHGLFQTAAYARAVYEAARPEADEAATQRHVELRLQRQKTVLGRTPPARITSIMSEGALARVVGSRSTMDDQIAHLRQVAEREHIDTRVLPFDAGAHAAMLGDFALLDFNDEEDPALVYLESEVYARYLEQTAQLNEYRRTYDLAYKRSVPILEYLR